MQACRHSEDENSLLKHGLRKTFAVLHILLRHVFNLFLRNVEVGSLLHYSFDSSDTLLQTRNAVSRIRSSYFKYTVPKCHNDVKLSPLCISRYIPLDITLWYCSSSFIAYLD